MARTKLIKLRRGTRAEFAASDDNWKPGELGWITETDGSATVVIATLDAVRSANVFRELKETSPYSALAVLSTSTPESGFAAKILVVAGFDSGYTDGPLQRQVGDSAWIFTNNPQITHLAFGDIGYAGRTTSGFLVSGLPNVIKLESPTGSGAAGSGVPTITIDDMPSLATIVFNDPFALGTGSNLLNNGVIYLAAQGELPLVTLDLNANTDLTGVTFGSGNTFPNLLTVDVSSTAFTFASAQALEAILPTAAGTLTIDNTPAVLDGNWAAGTNLKADILAKGWTVND